MQMPVNSSKDEPLSLPQGWHRVKLGDLCNLVNGDAYRDTDWSTSGTPIIRIQNLNNHAKPFNHWAGSLDDRVIVKDGDILLAWSGTPGTSFGTHRWNRGLGVLNQHIFRVDFHDGAIDPDWAVFAINEQLGEMIGRAHGAVGLRHVTRKEVDSLEILCPPLPEQRRIGARLREQLAEVAQARAALQAQRGAARKLPAGYLRAVFTGAAAANWPKQTLTKVCDLLPSKSVALAADADVRTVTSACLNEVRFNPAGIKPARMWAADVPAATVRPGEILVSRSNTPELVGRASLVPSEPGGIVASDLTIRIWPKEVMANEFLARYLSFLFVTGYWIDRAGGASGTMKKITRAQIEAEQVPMPPLEKQQSVVARLSDEMTQSEQLESVISDRLAALDRLPPALLREAFAGRL